MMFYLKGSRPVVPVRFAGGRLRGEVVQEYDTPALHAVLADPVTFMHSENVSVLKDNARSRVVRAHIDGRAVVVKESHAKTRLKALQRALLLSRAARGWYATHTVEALDIPTAAPIAYVERRYGPFHGRSWLISEWVPGQGAIACLTSPSLAPEERRRLVNEMVGIYARLHRANVTHCDNRPDNFLIRDGRPVLIDLDTTIRHPPWSFVRRRYMRQDVRGLIERWGAYPEIADEFRQAFRAFGLDGA